MATPHQFIKVIYFSLLCTFIHIMIPYEKIEVICIKILKNHLMP
uniref:Uncharacterized protein n=1 Tax=Anguilla anguilla TaxID=7936 RepID=A0A0E9R3I2_ANGAN